MPQHEALLSVYLEKVNVMEDYNFTTAVYTFLIVFAFTYLAFHFHWLKPICVPIYIYYWMQSYVSAFSYHQTHLYIYLLFVAYRLGVITT